MSRQRKRERNRKRYDSQPSSNRNLIITALVAVVLIAIVAVAVYFRNQIPANESYPVVNGVSCDRGEHSDFHIHQHASIYIDGKPVTVPANIGIASDGSCLYWLHTHSNDGIIHVEAPQDRAYTFGMLLDIWKDKFPELGFPSQLNSSTGWTVYVDGKPYSGDLRSIPLKEHTLITIGYNSPDMKPDTEFNWGNL